jgi:hypothetical protein
LNFDTREFAELAPAVLIQKPSPLPGTGRTSASIRGIQAIAGSTWDITLQQGVQRYKATILPKKAYASSTWYRSHPGYGQKDTTDKIMTILESVQKEALRVATGAWKTTALAALEVETNTLPVDLYLQQRNEHSLHRIKGARYTPR